MARRPRRGGSRGKHDMSSYDPDGPDFSGGGGFHIPDGDYLMECTGVEMGESKSSGNEMYTWTFKGKEGKAKGKQFYLYTPFSEPQHIQKLGKTFEALGIEVPDGEMDYIDSDDVEGVEVVGTVYTDEYQGEKRSKLQMIAPAEEAEETPRRGKKKDEEEEAPRRGRSRRAKDEEEEEETTTRRGRSRGNGKSKRAAKVEEDEIKDMSDDELEDLVGKHDLDVDLSKQKTHTKRVNAVLDAMGEADLLA